MSNEKKECCYLCDSSNFIIRPGCVRYNKNIDILECTNCGLVSLSSLDHIKSEHYENSGMHDSTQPDISSWIKETQGDDKRRYEFVKEKIINNRILDFGCGTGGFLDLAKLSGSKVAGVELEKALQALFKEKGLNVFPNLEAAQKEGSKWDLITAFHVVEHLPDPKYMLRELASLLSDEGELIIEVPNSNDALLTLYDNKAFQNFTYWSQHLYLFNQKTLSELVKQAGLKLNWIKHVQRYPLSNHLYWLANGKPGGHSKWGFMNNIVLDSEYENELASLGMTDTIIVGISKHNS
jgi:2-polyprenyl-3-methyl-5-hydroxy-6-metoxy-1,4-benzoquinol methylase